MAEERKDRKDMTHSEKIADHFRILGRPNPFAAAHSGTPAQRKGGLGSNKGAARYENTSAEDRAAANSDGRYGYFDEVNKRYVPALFDAMDGGGFDTRGDTFKGGIFSGMLNDMGVKPYGSEMERAMVSPDTSPIVQAVSGTIPRPQIRPNNPPPPSYANMDMGEAGRGSMPSTPLPYANMDMGEAGRGSMPAPTPLSYGTMDVGETGRGSLPNPFSGPTYDMPTDPRVQQMNIEVGAGVPLPASQATADEGFNRFLIMARNDPNMSFLMNDLPMAKSVYELSLIHI